MPRTATELAKDWPWTVCCDAWKQCSWRPTREHLLLVSGTGDVIQPTDGVAAIGSGGPYALAAARALMVHTELDGRTDRPRRLWKSPATCASIRTGISKSKNYKESVVQS